MKLAQLNSKTPIRFIHLLDFNTHAYGTDFTKISATTPNKKSYRKHRNMPEYITNLIQCL